MRPMCLRIVCAHDIRTLYSHFEFHEICSSNRSCESAHFHNHILLSGSPDMPLAEKLLANAESYRKEDSPLIGKNNLFKTLTAANKEEIEKDMRLYPTNKGKGKHTSLEFHIIVQAVSENWEILGGKSPVSSYEMLGRYNVREGSNAHKFIGVVYRDWPHSKKLEFVLSNLRTRQQSSLPTVNINMLPALWSQLVDPEAEVSKLVFACVGPNDFPEVQEFGDDGNVLRCHSEETKKGIRSYNKMTGGKVSVDDWSLGGNHCNSSDFVEEMGDVIKEVKVDIKLTMAVFGIRMTEEQSPDCKFLNAEVEKMLNVEGKTPEEVQAELRGQCLTKWEQWTGRSIFVCWEASVQQEHVNSWPELKASNVITSFLKVQGSIMFAATVTQEAAESAMEVPGRNWLGDACKGTDGCFMAVAVLGVLVAVYVGVRF